MEGATIDDIMIKVDCYVAENGTPDIEDQFICPICFNVYSFSLFRHETLAIKSSVIRPIIEKVRVANRKVSNKSLLLPISTECFRGCDSVGLPGSLFI